MLSVEDYRLVAKKKLPRVVFDYVDGGAETEFTVRENRGAFQQVTLRPRGGVDPSGSDMSTTVLGHELSMPILLSPCGMARTVHPGGDVAGARAAAKAGTIFSLSTMSGHTVEEVVAAANGSPVWYQAYRVGTRERAERAIRRAHLAGASALLVTMDTAVGSLRERDRRSGGLSLLGSSKLRAAPHFFKLFRTPSWLRDHLLDGIRPKLMNVVHEDGTPQILGRGGGPSGIGWHDLNWVRDAWPGPIIIKGLLTGDDASRAADEGAAAVIISNHGGRQLDTANATLRALPEIVQAVDGRCEVLLDGGIRSGIDVIKALSLGARAVMVGRPWLYGLGVGGQDGIEAVLKVLRDGLVRNMGLLGVKKVSELDESFVNAPKEWFEPAPVALHRKM